MDDSDIMQDFNGTRESPSKSMGAAVHAAAVLPQHVVNISQRSMRNVTHMFKASTDNLRMTAFKKLNKNKSNDKLD